MVSPLHDAPASYWFSRSAPPEELDLVVVGAGLVGLSTAYWAARHGVRPVVLDAVGVGTGATGRSNGFLLTGGLLPFTRLAARVGQERAELFWELSRENTTLLADELLGSGRVRCGYQAEGSWRAGRVGSAAEREWQESVELLSGNGYELSWRAGAEVRERSSSRLLAGGVFTPRDGGVDPVALCRGLADLAEVEVRLGARVRHLEPAGDRVLLVLPGGRILARRVVLAVNAAIGPLVSSLAGKVVPMALQGLATGPGERVLEGIWAIASDGLYLRQLGDGTVLASGGATLSAVAEGGFLELPTASGQASLEESIRELFPRVGGQAAHHRWAGTIALTGDGLPWVRTVPELPAVAYASGFNGQGLSVGFALGRRLARWLAGEDGALPRFQVVREATSSERT